MFQQEFREMISLLVNVICAVAVLMSIVFGLNLKNRVGAATSETYTAQRTMDMHYEFNAYDGKTLTADECIAVYSSYINSDVNLCVVVLNSSAKQGGSNSKFKDYEIISKITDSDINSVAKRTVEDYRKDPTSFSTENIRLGLKTGYTFNQLKKYKVYLAYDEEEEKYAMNKYVVDANTSKPRPSRISAIVFVEME